jgi:hypothetical protein
LHNCGIPKVSGKWPAADRHKAPSHRADLRTIPAKANRVERLPETQFKVR